MLTIPDTFSLAIELDGLEFPCALVRKAGNQAGVRFVGPPQHFKPVRAQIVEARVPVTLSLRKKPITP